MLQKSYFFLIIYAVHHDKEKMEKHKNTKTEMGDEEDLAMTQNLEATK